MALTGAEGVVVTLPTFARTDGWILYPSTLLSAAQVFGMVFAQLVLPLREMSTALVKVPVLEKLFDTNTSGVPPPNTPVPPRMMTRSVGFQLKPTRGWIRYFSSNVWLLEKP